MPHLSAGSTIINTASVNAYDPEKNVIAYAATKGYSDQRGGAGPIWTPLQPSGGP
jgi:hypothetical protein